MRESDDENESDKVIMTNNCVSFRGCLREHQPDCEHRIPNIGLDMDIDRPFCCADHHQQTMEDSKRNRQSDSENHLHHHHHPYHSSQPHPHQPRLLSNNIKYKHSRHKFPTHSLWTVCVTFFLSIIFLSSHISHRGGGFVLAHSCAPCDLELCPSTKDCPGGTVLGICKCCQVCARIENESCGGPFGIRGKCDRNLQCFIRPEIGRPITGSEEGICKGMKHNCEGTNCPPIYESLLCPPDSNLVTFASGTTRRFDGDHFRRIRDISSNEAYLHQEVINSTVSPTSQINTTKMTSKNSTHHYFQNSNTTEKTANINPSTLPPNVVTNSGITSNGNSINTGVTSRDSIGSDAIGDSNYVSTTYSSLTASSIYPPQLSPSFSEGENSNELGEVVPDRMSYCVCNYSQCLSLLCAAGFTPVVIRSATGYPGSCCDVFTCNQTKGCDPVICPPLDQTPCPEDSIRLPSIWTEDKCCELQQGCSCLSSERCKPVQCPLGYRVQIISRATGQPGSCCDNFRCVDESGMTCRYNGQEMKNGHKWNIDRCRSCECKDGLNICRDKTCKKLSCLWSVIPENECCPICRGCVSDSGNFYNNSDVWKENACTTCRCVEGQVQCQAEMCSAHCANPVRVPGQCCPVCPADPVEATTRTSTSLSPVTCPSLDRCSLECSAGLELSPTGCFLCKCKKEMCTLNCRYGMKIDYEGNEMCECKPPELLCPPWEEDQCGKKCEYGYRRSRDGCIKCKCNRCPPINCTKRCLHGLMVNDEGCQICKCREETVPELTGPPTIDKMDSEFRDKKESCLSQYGVYHENGESWNDGCRICYCHKRVEMCSLIACPAPHCSNPVFKIGDCCPSCPGLTIPSSNGKQVLCQSTSGDYYVEGQTWNMDACTRCVCHGGTILCETMACRPVLCHHPVRQQHQCCPTCTGEDFSLLPPTPLHRRCKAPSGMPYKHGEVWKSSPCQTCVCQDGQFHCYNQMCSPISCNKTLLRKDQCCPTCVEPVTSKSKVCTYNNERYALEEKWEGDNCTQCMCSAGKVHCFPLTCPSLGCSIMVQKRGQCCPSCYELPSKHKDFKDHLNTSTDAPKYASTPDRSYIGMIILVIILVAFACIIIYLVYQRYLQRQKDSLKGTQSQDELQGETFLSQTQNKSIDVEIKQPAREKLYSSLTEKENRERAFNTYTDLNFCDQNKNTQIF